MVTIKTHTLSQSCIELNSGVYTVKNYEAYYKQSDIIKRNLKRKKKERKENI